MVIGRRQCEEKRRREGADDLSWSQHDNVSDCLQRGGGGGGGGGAEDEHRKL